MPRRKVIAKREVAPDPLYQSQLVTKFMNTVMLDGKMEDDASVKQCRVVVELARALSERDPELAASYGF